MLVTTGSALLTGGGGGGSDGLVEEPLHAAVRARDRTPAARGDQASGFNLVKGPGAGLALDGTVC